MSKPLEYWIYPYWEAAFEYPDALGENNREQIHVIEYSAYEAVCAERDIAIKALEQITRTPREYYGDVAREALIKLKESK